MKVTGDDELQRIIRNNPDIQVHPDDADFLRSAPGLEITEENFEETVALLKELKRKETARRRWWYFLGLICGFLTSCGCSTIWVLLLG